MGISKVTNRWLNRTYKCIAIFLVVFAVLISALRMLLPYAHNYRLDLQGYINDTYGSDIVIGALEMGWQSSGPTLVASNVSLLQTDEAEVFVQAFDMNVDFWQSLRHRRLITKDFSLSGVNILFDNSMVSEASASSNDSLLLTNLTELFFSQIGRFSVKDSQVIYQTKQGSRTLLIDSLHWLNQGNNHLAHGNVIVDGITSNNLQLNLNVQGEHIDDMKGTLYLEANQVNITPWLGKVLAIANENTHSSINFNAWLSIDNGQLDKLQLSLGKNQISWQHNEVINTLDIDNGQVIIANLNTPEQLHLYSSAIEVASNQQSWQPLSFEFKRDYQALTGYISGVNISGSADLFPLLVKDSNADLLIEQLAPIGNIEDIYLHHTESSTSVIANISDLSTQYSQGIPGIEHVNGQLIYQPGKLNLAIAAENGQLDFNQHFAKPIDYQSLAANLAVQFYPHGWQLAARDIAFASEQLKLSAELALFSSAEQELEMSLLATATDGNVIFAPNFYPHLLMGDDLVNYLNGALEKGRLNQALVLINGPINDFPFTQGNGTFIVDGELTNSTFKFDSQWPAIEHFNANLNFTNNSMLITGRDGTLGGIDVKGVRAAIDDLSHEQTLSIDARFAQTKPSLIANLMMTSPFSDSIGAVLEKVVVGEKVAGDFQLNLPLANTEAAVAKGNVLFNNNTIKLQSPQMHFSQVNGRLSFINDEISTQALTAVWRDMPLTIQVEAQDQPLDYQTEISLQAHWQDELWSQQLPDKLREYGSGILDWQGKLILNNRHDGQFNYALTLDSNLEHLRLDLPAPYNKLPEIELLAKIKVSGDEDQSTIDAQIGEQLNFYGNLNHQQVAFSQAHLILGDEQMYLPMNGFHITTNLAEADFFQWQPFIGNIIDSIASNTPVSDNQPRLLEQPERVRGNIGRLTFWDESIHGVSFSLEDQLSWWLLELTSKEARTAIKFYPDWHTQGLDITADFIRLSPEKALFSKTKSTDAESKPALASTANTIEKPLFDLHVNDQLFANIPPMRVKCNDCTYANLNLGEVSFTLERNAPELVSVNNFVAKRKNAKLNFDAKWHHNNTQSLTQITGELTAKDIERELERLGLPSTVKDSGLNSKFDMQWFGGPHDFAIANLNGNLSGSLNEGYLAEVPDQARAFSILSLQSLVRKLKFDFRDIFSDGMFYSEVKGDFQLKNGVIYTKNTFLKGNAGDLSVKGNTNLNTDVLDYKMSYKPNYSSSLPAIAWIATLNPVTFLAGIAIDEVITAKVYKEIFFEVSGTIQEVNFRRIDGKQQNVSIGRDSPPQIVENLPEEQDPNITPVKPKNKLLHKKTKAKSNSGKIDG